MDVLMKTRDLIDEVVALPVEERALLIDTLLRSLNPPESDVDEKWISVAKRRLEELRTGQVSGVPSDEVFAKVRKRFPK